MSDRRADSERSEGAPTAPRRLDPRRAARVARRVTIALVVLAAAWFFLKFDTRWVGDTMNTNPDIPPGAWVIVDAWSSGLRVGSDVFVETPNGELLSRVSALTEDTVEIRHVDQHSSWPDSGAFGPLPRANVRGTIVVVFAGDEGAGDGR